MTPYLHLPYSHNSLKAFESVARHMSFTLAAQELNVTQSAVSRQVKQLEDDLKASLVIRKHRAIELTLRGQALYTTLAKNYQTIESLVGSWQEPDKQQRIVIKSALSFATRSLIPKIQQFNERYPKVEIVVLPVVPLLNEDYDAQNSLDPQSNDYDLLIFSTRHGSRYRHHANISFLREEYMAPVCTNQIATNNSTLSTVLSAPRLHASPDHHDWETWLAHSGHHDTFAIAAQRHSTFFSLDLALSACLCGQGVTVTDLLLVLPELERGYLFSPTQVPIQQSLWQYFCHHNNTSPIVEALIQWLQMETAKDIAHLKTLAKQHRWHINAH
jgi:LysR family glycine cleavage system transcriptional activator